MTSLASGRAAEPSSPARPVVGLIRACHPIPTAGVTAFSFALAFAAGNGGWRSLLVAAAIMTGQLTIGWSNDALDVQADRYVGRTDKPIALGVVSMRTVQAATALAGAACVGLSLALGWRAGVLHLAAVACGWIYNLKLKGTWFSWLPYALAFGALPGVATLALPEPAGPAWWAVVAGALLGVAANLTNALPDLERDRVTGFRGLANRIGARASIALAVPLLVIGAACVAFGPPGRPGVIGVVGFALVAAIAVGSAPAMLARAESRVPFYGLMLLVPIDVIMVLAQGSQLS